MASQPNIEYEAAKFLHKLIQDSKDEPDKLATKLYVILQHMKASGKENSMPYQVISRAMETVVNQHGHAAESMMSAQNLVNSGPQIRDSINPQSAGCSQIGGAQQDSKSGVEIDSVRNEAFSSGRPPAGPSSMTNDTYPGSVPNRSAVSFDHESPSSVDTKSANSTSHERLDASSWEQQATKKDSKRSNAKRKRPESSATDAQMGDCQHPDAQNPTGDARKGKVMNRMDLPVPFPGSSLPPVALTTAPERSVQGHLSPSDQRELAMGGALSNPDMSMWSGISRDTGKSPMLPMSSSSLPFKEHHLKQLRAQCLVFLAFRNGLMPKRLHLEMALGNSFPTEGAGCGADGLQRELVVSKEKEITINESSNNPDTVTPKATVSMFATAGQTENSREDADNRRLTVKKSDPYADPAVNYEERKPILAAGRVLETEMQNQGTSGAPAFLAVQSQHGVSRLKSSSNLDNCVDNGHLHVGAMNEPSVMGMNNQPRPEMISWAAVGGQNEASRRPFSSSVAQHELLTGKDSSPSHSQGFGEVANQGHHYADSNLSALCKPMQGTNNEKQRMVLVHDAMLLRHGPSGSLSDASHLVKSNAAFPQLDKTNGPEETDKFSAGIPPPKYTTSEKWIMIQEKSRVVNEENWMKKQQRVDQGIAARCNELKETVSSSEDISAKTRSVIELKKLQLVKLQRSLRSNILNDFFKPITVEIDRLKAIKKHRVGRRLKHVEKYEQRMKEERQKRVNERQKEFFGELEFHKERLDDVFKFKKERLKGFNRYAKEFHKRKERVHREKIDRIQREKINLLKVNDVEGYLRMVQDAKSDRVKQLLKETEKYLQKLSAKLQEAKSSAKHFETDTNENQSTSVIDTNDTATETEDESDQAKHYKESNEKYYLMAHSVKEIIPEQPTGLIGGKLREYQMNGLRWLVSLYNNHLNGILADEMGLGKTVQVISLICYLMETKNDRGPFLVVVPSSVLPGWETELNFWAPGVNKIVYAGPPDERRRLFKEIIVHQKFNVLLTTYEYLMNKHDRPKLSKVNWRYIIIDEGHRIKNASCKLNADLKHYNSSHRLLLTGTPLQNSLEELWALLNFLLPNIFNSAEDFSQWFNKPFESNGDSSPDEALLSEEENLLIINRLHQVLRPFVLRRLKHKVENQLPGKIERLVRCDASAYQKLLMKRVEDNLGSLVNSKARSVHNSVMELRNICNHPYLSQLHVDEVDTLIPKHFLPPIIRLCGKLEMLDRLLPKLKATNHRVLFFSTMTRLLDVMEEYLAWKNYQYVRLDGHTSGQERGALIEQFNRSDSPYFIFLLSIRAGGVGVNLQAADTVIIFDTDWNPQVDLQAQARAHRIGQKKEVLVLRLETVNTVEEQVRASAEHKLGVANQSITAGFFDNNTSAEDRREYLEALLRECKKEEAAPVLDDDALNDLLARSEPEIDVFESVDQKRREEEMATWKKLARENGTDDSQVIPPLPSRLVTDDDLNTFNEAMKRYEVSAAGSDSDLGMKRKAGSIGGFDAQYYGRGKRSREVRSYEEQWTEDEFEKMCQTESLETLKLKEEQRDPQLQSESSLVAIKTEPPLQSQQVLPPSSVESSVLVKNVAIPPVKRGRGRPRRIPPSPAPVPSLAGPVKPDTDLQKVSNPVPALIGSSHDHAVAKETIAPIHQSDAGIISRSDATPSVLPTYSGVQSTSPGLVASAQSKGQDKKGQVGAEPGRRRGRKPGHLTSTVSVSIAAQDTQPSEQLVKQASVDGGSAIVSVPVPSDQSKHLTSSVSVSKPSEQLIKQASMDGGSAIASVPVPSDQSKPKGVQDPCAPVAEPSAGSSTFPIVSGNAPDTVVEPGPTTSHHATAIATHLPANYVTTPSGLKNMPARRQSRRSQSGAEPVLRRGRRRNLPATTVDVPSAQYSKSNEPNNYSGMSAPQSMKVVPPVPGSANLSVASQDSSLVPISGFVQGTATLKDATVPLHNVTVGSAPIIPSPKQPIPSTVPFSHTEVPCAPGPLTSEGQNKKGPTGQIASRRRGRKKGSSLAVGSSNVIQSEKSPSLSESIIKKPEEASLAAAGQGKDVIESPALVSLDSKSEDQHGLSSSILNTNKLTGVASSLDRGAVESSMPYRNVAVSHASLTRKVEVSTPLVNLPSTGRTTVIVLALKACSSTSDKGGDAQLQVDAERTVSQPEVNVAHKAESTSQLDEDLIAPPGFDTPHAFTSDAAVIGVPLASEDSKGNEEAVAANKRTLETESRATVGSDQSLMDPVKILEEKSAPPGFETGDTVFSKTRSGRPLHIKSRDISARAEASEPPPGFGEASLPPGFGVAQAHPKEVGSENTAPSETNEVSLPPGCDVSREDEDPLKKLQGASEVHACSHAPVVSEPDVHEQGRKNNMDELSGTGIVHAGNVSNIAEPMHRTTECVAPAQAEACLHVNILDMVDGGRDPSNLINNVAEFIQPALLNSTDVDNSSCNKFVIYDQKQSVELPDTGLPSALSSDLSASASKDVIGVVQSDLPNVSTTDVEESMQMGENNDNMEIGQKSIEEDEPQQEKVSESFGGLNRLEGKSTDLGETCLRDYSSTEMETDTNDIVNDNSNVTEMETGNNDIDNDTSKVMDISAGTMHQVYTNLVNPSQTADAAASSMPQVQNEGSPSGPSLAENGEKHTDKLEPPSISLTCHKDKVASDKQYANDDASSLHIEASGAELQLGLVSNADESHGTHPAEQKVFCMEVSGIDCCPSEEHIRSSDAGDDLALASKGDSSRGPDVPKEEEDQSEKEPNDHGDISASAVCPGAVDAALVSKVKESQGASDAQEDGSPTNFAETIARSSPSETNLEAICILSETREKDEVDFKILRNSGHEASIGDTSSPQDPKEGQVSQEQTDATQLDSSYTNSESGVLNDEADPEMVRDTGSPQASKEKEIPQRQTAAIQLVSSCTISGSDVPNDEVDPELLHNADLGVSKDQIDSSQGLTDSGDQEAACTISDVTVQDQTYPKMPSDDAECGALKEKIDPPRDTEVQKESKEQTFQETEEQKQLEVTCTVLGSEMQKDEADPEILPDAELSVPENEVDGLNSPEEIESQKLSIIMQPEDPCNTEVFMEEADPEIPPEEQKLSQEKELFLNKTANDLSAALCASMEAEGLNTTSAKILLDTDVQGTEFEIDASQTREEKGELLELAVRAEVEASDTVSRTGGQDLELNSETLVGAHAQLSNEIGASQGCEEQTGHETIALAEMKIGCTNADVEGKKNRTSSEVRDDDQVGPEGPKFGSQPEGTISGMECQNSEADAGKDEVRVPQIAASPVSEDAGQKNVADVDAEMQADVDADAEMQADVDSDVDAECSKDGIGAPQTPGYQDGSQNPKNGALPEAPIPAPEIECRENEYGADIGASKDEVVMPQASQELDEFVKTTAGAQLEADSALLESVCQKIEALPEAANPVPETECQENEYHKDDTAVGTRASEVDESGALAASQDQDGAN